MNKLTDEINPQLELLHSILFLSHYTRICGECFKINTLCIKKVT